MCVHVCVRVCVRACVCVCVRACAYLCLSEMFSIGNLGYFWRKLAASESRYPVTDQSLALAECLYIVSQQQLLFHFMLKDRERGRQNLNNDNHN